MDSLIIAFITGLTTGGLSCLAVQGGLLASSLGNQIEKDIQAAGAAANRKKNKNKNMPPAARTQLTLPILAFLAAKLLAYTFMGFLLGLLGSVFQLSPMTRAFLQIAIGIFMLGSALRMLNVHPFFRHFAFETPTFLRRKIRKTAAASEASLTTPALLGLLTVLIPCGITQAMMAAAIGTGSPLSGAALMFAFTLGTSPVFFAVAFFATQLGSRMEKLFMRFVAVVMLVLGIFAIDTGLTLAGSPVSLTRMMNSVWSPPQQVQASPSQPEAQFAAPNNNNEASSSASGAGKGNVVTINIENTGYNPNVVHAKAGEAVQLRLVSENVYSCSLAFVIPSLGIQKNLATTGEALIDIPAQKAGSELPFSCSMGMFTGVIIFDL